MPATVLGTNKVVNLVEALLANSGCKLAMHDMQSQGDIDSTKIPSLQKLLNLQ
jgi:hypothetical protein